MYNRRGIRQLSPKTNLCDLSRTIRDYLKECGHVGSRIGDTPVFVRYEGGVQVAIGPTEESVKGSGPLHRPAPKLRRLLLLQRRGDDSL